MLLYVICIIHFRYNPYIGDGDSKAYRRVVDDQPYGPDYDIMKEECRPCPEKNGNQLA